MRKTLIGLGIATLALLAIAQPAAAHPSAWQEGPVYYIFNHHIDLIVVETNGVTGQGVMAYSGNVRPAGGPPTASGAQIHHACVDSGYDLNDVYPSRSNGVFFGYIIAQGTTAGFDGGVDVADATAFWAGLGVDVNDEEQVHDACHDIGGEIAQADVIAFSDDDLGGDGGEENVDLRDTVNTVNPPKI